MRIQNNMMAMNTHRQYSINNSNAAKSSEKLSSGYRINRAGDDAAGLAISEKMRAQIRGLNMASKNSQDAISLVQTAEGALQEVHSMLQRMNELANQSATGTNEDFDRKAINAEFAQLKSEIDDIANQTTFNNMKLLDGSLGEAKMAVASTSTLATGKNIAGTNGNYSIFGNVGATAAKAGTFAVSIGTYDGSAFAAGAAASATHLNVEFTDATTGDVKNTVIKIDDAISGDIKNGSSFTLDLGAAGLGSFSISAASIATDAPDKADFLSALDGTTVETLKAVTVGSAPAATIASTVNGIAATSTWTGFSTAGIADTLGRLGVEIPDDGNMTLSITHDGTDYSLSTADGTVVKSVTQAALAAAGSINFGEFGTFTAVSGGGTDANVGANILASTLSLSGVAAGEAGGSGAIKVQVGALEGEQLSIAINKMSAEGLGLQNASISLQEDAGKAITQTRAAINTVSDQRALLGAMQNRLQHKINNLDISAENLNAAESRIRDVDMAKEMTNFTKQNILSQAATAMLAQANAAPQNVLQLLG